MDAIEFLESAGRRRTGGGGLMLQDWAGFDLLAPGARDALLSRDRDALARMLDARPVMLCMVSLPDGGETELPDEAPDTDEPDDDSPPAEEEPPTPA